MLVCERCGEQNPEQARFCMACTAPLGGSATDAGRRTVSIVFSDLVGSTALGESLDPEALREVLDRYFDAMKACLERYGGLVEKYIGDAIMAVFGLPRTHEDDALRATLAASAMRERLATLNEELGAAYGVALVNRTGVHTGEVVTGDPATGLRLVTGDAVNTAARLEQAAPPGEILLGGPTHDLVAHAATVEEVEPIAAKGKAEAVPAFLLRSVRPLQAIARRPVGDMVGRERELGGLLDLFRTVIERRTCKVATIVGEPGVGKSRLVAELTERVSVEARILSGRCLPYGDDMTYWPISEAIREAAAISEDADRDEALERLRGVVPDVDGPAIIERLATVMGLSPEPYSPEELSWAIRRLIEHLARSRPLVLVLDDVQRAADRLIETVDHVATFARDARVLIVLASRPELLGGAATPSDGAWSAPIVLTPLDDADVDTLLARMLPGTTMSASIAKKVKAAAQGNPLFVEQLAASWIDPDRSSASASDGGRSQVPPSIDALLRSRIDALPLIERRVLECGAVIGQVFYRGAVSELSGVSSLEELDERLDDLRSQRFVRPDVSLFADDKAWAFVHLLLRDAAYDGILKRTRSDLHERYASWLERRARDRLGEMGDILAFHLERAFFLIRELGSIDASAEGLRDRAAAALMEGATRAISRSDYRSASRLLARAARLQPPGDRDGFLLLVRAMDFAVKDYAIEEALRLRNELPAGPPDDVSAARLRSVEIEIAAIRAEETSGRLLQELTRACDVLRMSGDVEGLLLCMRRQARLLGWLGRIGDARTTTLELSILAKGAGRTDLEVDALVHVAMCAAFDTSNVGPAIELCRATILEHEGDRRYRLPLTRPMAILVSMQGDADLARRSLDDMARMNEDLGASPAMNREIAEARAIVEIAVGNPVAVAEILRPLYEEMLRTGETFASSYAALLAHAAAERDLVADALSLAEEARLRAHADDYDAQVGWRTARGLALSVAGDPAEAEALVRAALRIVEDTEDLTLQAEVVLDLARVVFRRGRPDEATKLVDRAIDLFTRKGHLAGVARAERLKREGWLTPAS